MAPLVAARRSFWHRSVPNTRRVRFGARPGVCSPHAAARSGGSRALGFADGSDNSLVRRLAGAAYPHPRGQRGDRLCLADPAGALDGPFRIRHLHLCLDLGVAASAAWSISASARRRSASSPNTPSTSNSRCCAGFFSGSRWLALLIATLLRDRGRASRSSFCRRISTPRQSFRFICPAPHCRWSASGRCRAAIARSYDWVNLGLAPNYILRQLVLLGLMALVYAVGLPTDAVTGTLVGVIAVSSVSVGQLVVLNRKLTGVIAEGPKAYAVRSWLATSTPIFVVEAFYLLLTYSDVLSYCSSSARPTRSPIYYAAAKTLAFVAFIYYSVAQTIAHKFAEYHVSRRARAPRRLSQAVGAADVLAVARPRLSCCSRWGGRCCGCSAATSCSGYYLMFILAVGLLARASVGPAERLLNMLGERRSCALVYAGCVRHRSRPLHRALAAARDRRRGDCERGGAGR